MPVVALHGVTTSQRSFAPVMRHLPAELRVVALTQCGHGNSDKPADEFRPCDFTTDVAAFMETLEIKRAVLVRYSMDSINVLLFALDYPSRVADLLLAGSMPYFGRPPEVLAFQREQIAPITDPVPHTFAQAFQQSTLAIPVEPALLDVLFDESPKAPACVWRAAFAGFPIDDLLEN